MTSRRDVTTYSLLKRGPVVLFLFKLTISDVTS